MSSPADINVVVARHAAKSEMTCTKKKPSALEEPVLCWINDIGARRSELPAVKASFRALVEIEMSAGALPKSTAAAKICGSPPVRFKALADAALVSIRDAVEKRLSTLATEGPPPKKRRCETDDDDVLKIYEIMEKAEVWKGIWNTYRTDLSNEMHILKCAETGGQFSDRRPEVVRGHIVDVHKYLKSKDWPLAAQAVERTRAIYEKRIREFLEEMFVVAGWNKERTSDMACLLARDIAKSLKGIF